MEWINATRIGQVNGTGRVSMSTRKEGEVVYLWIHDPETKVDRVYIMTLVDWERLTH